MRVEQRSGVERDDAVLVVAQLIGELEGRRRQIPRDVPASREPLDLEAMEQQMGARALIAAASGALVGRGEQRAGGVEVREAHQPAGLRDARALVEFQRTSQPLLDRDAALEQAGADLER